MTEEVQATVKIPISELVAALRKRHGLPSKLTGARIEGNIIILNFAEGAQKPLELPGRTRGEHVSESSENEETTSEEPGEPEEPAEPEETEEPEEPEERHKIFSNY